MNIPETIIGLEEMLFKLHPKAESLYVAIKNLKIVEGTLPLFEKLDLSHYVVGESSIAKEPNTKNQGEYNVNANIKSKVVLAIKSLNRFVKTKEIAEYIVVQEPTLNIKDVLVSLSNPLYHLKTDNVIHKISTGAGKAPSFWGSAKWLGEDGNPLPEHMYKEEMKQEEIEF